MSLASISLAPFSRRSLLRFAGATAAGALLAPAWIHRVAGQSQRWPQGDPFSLGVAAGSPSSDGFVLWTRLAPQPLAADPERPGGISGGSSGNAVPVGYEIATDPGMTHVMQEGTGTAEPEFAYSVHVEAKGLQAGRSYWYRFTSGEAQSPIGRAITLPSAGTTPERLRFGFVSCSNYELGYFSAYRHLADEQPDLVLFLGDYIYESINKSPDKVRHHSDGVEAATLPAYRNRYTQYRLDPDLQRLHREVPSLLTWDDHEVQNDYADKYSETFDDPAQFLKRRAAAYQAFYEHMPVKPSLSRPAGPDMRVYDRFSYGNLAQIFMLDGRQYRSREACYGPPKKGGGHMESNVSCPERLDESRFMLGRVQEQWLFDGLSRSPVRWNLLGQDVMMAQFTRTLPGMPPDYWTDGWDGYPADRTRLIRHLHERKVSNPVVLSGDIHCYWANELKLNFDDPSSATVATEFVGTSITSSGMDYAKAEPLGRNLPHVRFFDSRVRGYVSVDLTAQRMVTRFRAIYDRTDPKATVSTLRTFVVENGKPGPVEG
jgi:alkaline phosphatase D